MFVSHAEPVSLTQVGLEGLCVSLNRPVVDIDQLPAGPARAAIALHRRAHGERCLFVAVRSIESGAVALFAFDEPPRSRHKAMDEGLSFAEGMGFLFDDDMLEATATASAGAADGAGGLSAARRALECWCGLVGEEPPPDSQLGAVADLEPDSGEILEVGDVEPLDILDAGVSAVDDGMLDERVDLFDPELEDQVPLSKFRPGQEEPDPLGQSTKLGRVAIVRRRVSDGEPTPDFATRLLASF